MKTPFGQVVQGAVAGLAATGAMSSVLWVAERAGALHGLPPRLIVDHLLPGLTDRSAARAATLLHLVIGASSGALLGGALRGRGRGVPFGLLLWAIGYEGVVPVLGVLPPAHRDRPLRVATMIGAHVVYGSVLGRALRSASRD